MKEFLHNLLDAVSLRQRYIVFESEQPTGLCKPAGIAGATGLNLDLTLQPWLESRGEWTGRRPAIWIDDVSIWKVAARHSVDEKLSIAAVTLHEAAHVAEHPQTPRDYTPGVRDAIVRLAAYTEANRHHASVPPFHQHGWRFVRNCVHLRHRACAAGLEIPGHWIFDGEVYELPSLDQFDSSLLGGMEARHLAAEPIDQVNTYRPPRAFEDLWQRSLRAWLAKQTTHTEAIRVAIDMIDIFPDPE